MRYSYESNLRWQKGTGVNHDVQLQMGLKLEEFLRGRDIPTTLATNQNSIRAEIKKIVIEEIIPKIFADVGAVPVEGKLNTHSTYDVSGQATTIEMKTPQGIDIEIRDRLSIALNITTNRPVTALEALQGSSIAVADAITNDIMMHLAHTYLGARKHRISSDSSVRNDSLIRYNAQHETDAPNRN